MDNNKSPAKVLLSVTEISKEYGLSKFLIRRFVSEGLPVVKSGRKIYINKATFDNYIQGGR